MPTEGYKIRDQNGIYFLTFSIVGWIDLFSRQIYKDIFIENLQFYSINRGLVIYAYVIMSNHIHLILSSETGKLSDTIRDLKKYTSKQFISYIENDIESRKSWMLHQFKYFASRHSKNETYQVWTHDNHPEECFGNAFIEQKLNYIHQNPVRAGIVFEPQDYKYSSARNYAGLEAVMPVRFIR